MRFVWTYENPGGIDNGTWTKILDTETDAERGGRIVATAENGIMAQAFCDVLNGDQTRFPEGLVYVN